jgi:hypothetical protein
MFIRKSKMYVKMALETGNSLRRGSRWRICLPGTLRDSKRVLDKWSVTMGDLLGALRGKAPLLGTLEVRYYQYPETDSKTVFGP